MREAKHDVPRELDDAIKFLAVRCLTADEVADLFAILNVATLDAAGVQKRATKLGVKFTARASGASTNRRYAL